jgi:hypothetical protein
MVEVFLSHSAASREVAATVAARLERCAEAKVWLDELPDGSNLLDSWEGGLSSTAILMILDASSVPPQSTRETWAPLLDHITENSSPRIGCVRVGSCAYPKLLERKAFFSWQEEPLSVLRSIEAWIVGLHEQEQGRAISPMRVPWFEGGGPELDALWRTLVDEAGSVLTVHSPGVSGKTALAQEFAAQAADHFRDVLWIGCSGMSAAGVSGELASQLGAVTTHGIPDLLHEHRLLVVFDDLHIPMPVDIRQGSRSSILVTSRQTQITPGAGLELDQEITVPEIRPPENVADRELWHALSVCRPHGVALDLPTAMAGLLRSEANSAIDRLVSARLADRLDPNRVRLNASSRSRAQTEVDVHARRRSHAASVHEFLIADRPEAENLVSELIPALDYACENDWSMARVLGQRGSDFLRGHNRHGEAAELLRRLLTAARGRRDPHTISMCEWELSWIETGAEQVRYPVKPTEQLTLSFSL